MNHMEYAIVIERTGTGYSAFAPDLPGCIAAAESLEEIQGLIGEAVNIHVEEMRRNGETVPSPTTLVSYAKVA